MRWKRKIKKRSGGCITVMRWVGVNETGVGIKWRQTRVTDPK